ncbi:hypothetical protein G210_3237 [Candida maltosa Xu316]|uniref:Uncharacterized protein n=1 Tax=Candida maltosa (strain Xu316) TaxID=1245528 RepID=M3IJG1_CANMX|nr:hypothetical protein G210_3237 [Candida maltosa Xu316]
MSFKDMIQRYQEQYKCQLMPSVEPDIPNCPNVLTEKLQVNKQAAMLLHRLSKVSNKGIDLCPIPYQITSSKYLINVRESPKVNDMVGFTASIVKHEFPEIKIADVEAKNDFLIETIEQPAFKDDIPSTAVMKKWNSHKYLIDVSQIIKNTASPTTPMPKWVLSDTLNIFDIAPESITSEELEITPTNQDLLQMDHQSPLKYRFANIIINPNWNIPKPTFKKWLTNDDFEEPNITSLSEYLLSQNRVTESGKYLVYPVTKFRSGIENAKSLIMLFYIKHCKVDDEWSLPKNILVNHMNWTPIDLNVDTFFDDYLVEDIECGKVQHETVLEKTVLDFIVPEITPDDCTQGIITNVATYHNDTDEFEKVIVPINKRRKISCMDNTILPPEISMLSLTKPSIVQSPVKVEQIEEDTSIDFSTSFSEVSFSPNQGIIVDQSLWEFSFQLANELSEKITVIEMKLTYPVHIIINARVGIYLVNSDFLLQTDNVGHFLILDKFLEAKHHLHSLYIVCIVNNSLFFQHGGDKLQKLQLICVSINIKLVLVSPDHTLSWIFEIINLEEPESLSDFVDLNCDTVSFLVDVGLTYFQINRILHHCSFEEFIELDTKSKIQMFGNFIHPEILYELDTIFDQKLSKTHDLNS